LTSGSTFAEEQSGFELSAWANYYDVMDGDDNVWGPGLGVGIPLMGRELLLDFRASWLPDAGEDRFGDLELVPLDLGLSYHYVPCDNWGVSIMAGVTYAFADFDPRNEALDGIADINDEWGSYVGAGAEYKFNPNFGAFTNVYYRFLDFTTDRNNSASDREFEADGVNVDVGLKYYF
ncbi:MAG TPA: outer membrane beta-barrel protein, partial [Oligoflexia bacterium]|nr:outer membrane beta-barrel protein [Oligoflexia bacterium]